MKADRRWCRRPLLGALTVGLLVLGTSAYGQEIRFFPIRSAPLGSPVGTIGTPVTPVFNAGLNCWELTLTAGGVEVDIDLQGTDWELAAGTPGLGAVQGTVAPAGYSNGVGGDLSPKGWPDSRSDGAYQAQSACSDNNDPCVVPFDAGCGGRPGVFCIRNANWIMPVTCSDFPAIATPTLNYGFAVVGQVIGCAPGSGGNFLTFGGLILEVPADAAGTYLIDFNTGPAFSFMSADTGAPIPGVVFTPACITILCATDCNDGLACTTDLCNPETTTCENNIDAGACVIGGLCFSDGQEDPAESCRFCDVSLSQTEWSLRTAGAPCPNGVFCDGNESCLAGVCQSNVPQCDPDDQLCDELNEQCDLLGDVDGDLAVTLSDFMSWADCETGPIGGSFIARCRLLDFDGDGFIDASDFARFQTAFTSP